ncbi:MAG: SDR family oxidoreductase [Caldilineaceae bacterium]|nr:SDR family oxidoreductase [Caldilineaceae bacterium]
MSLAGKRALITGGGRGIGRGITLALAAQGCHVAIHYARKRAEAKETAQAASGLGVQTALVRANLRQEAEARRMVEEAAGQLGGLDILVGNAASGVLKPAAELENKDWEWTVSVNVRSILAAAQTALPHMRRGGWGRIITITSPGSRRVFPQYSIIGISKAALEALTRYLAVELAAEGITANCVSPGLVVTGALDFFPMRAEMLDHAQRNTPAGRLVTPEDVGAVVAWLCSDAAAMVVGQTIEVDGGYGLKMLG